jgi:lipoprotein-anchoring transpeptidase ErfK/SrfK
MSSQYTPNRPTKTGISRTILRLAIAGALLVGVYQGYPIVRGLWQGMIPGAAPRDFLDEARQQKEAGDVTKAGLVLDEGIAAEGNADRRYALLRMRIDLARESEAWALAGDLLQRTLSEYPNSPDFPVLAAAFGEALERQDRIQEARKQYEEIIKASPTGMQAPALIGLGRLAEKEQELVKARDYYRNAFNDAERESQTWMQALEAMGRLNIALIFGQLETPESKYYTVESGDTLTSIGIKLNTTQGLLTRANGIPAEGELHPGQRLKHTPKDFRIVVERGTCRIYLMDNQGPFKMYPTGLGMPGYETTLGKYTIGSKQKDPTWFRPNGTPVPPNDPANELGTRWMPMVPAEEGLPTDLGIHGTIAPETIGFYKSHGCPRLRNESAEELYDLIVRSTPVEVVEKIDWAAAPAGAAVQAQP